MDQAILKLKIPKECEEFILKYTDLINQARKRAIELRAVSHGEKSIVESKLLEAIYAYEEILTERNKRRISASRTWQMVKRYGIIVAAERAVYRRIEPQGYKFLAEKGLQELTFEAVIVRYPESFSKEIVTLAQQRLRQLDELSE